jgi:hypothetical protein
MEGVMNCHICKRELDQPGKPDTKDCGGDCLRCMAHCGDTDCEAVMRELEPTNSLWFGGDPDDA